MVQTSVEDWPYKYHWKNTPEREALFGKRCRIIAEGTQTRNVVVEFEDGQTLAVSARALRRVDESVRK